MIQKNILGIALSFGCALALSACGSGTSAQTITMAAVGTSGQSGTAVLTDQGNSMTTVVLATTGGSDTGTQLAHIHTGTCGSNGPIFTNLASVTNGTSSMTVPYALSALTGGTHYINIHNSVNPGTIQACGQIP